MIIFNSEKFPIKSWCNNPEANSLEQAKHLANLPFLFKHVCLMPDVHAGFGMPIGGVIACINTIIPNAVGVDIGCGMCAIKTSLKGVEEKELVKVRDKILQTIPLGFEHNKQAQKSDLIQSAIDALETSLVVKNEAKNLFHQLGTLGGGNHFIEIQKGDDMHIWFMIHSGSRNIGNKIAQYHNRIAIGLNQKIKSKVSLKLQLAYLPLETREAQNYLDEMNFALNFAKENRRLMALRIKEILNDIFDIEFFDQIDIHHNYASIEKHFKKEVIIHRKGATSAKSGEYGIIPGSQGSHSFITIGKGNPESFLSSSHGAGRVMGRKEAIRSLDLNKEIKHLEEQGVLHSIRRKKDLDEATSAYKKIDVVMQEQNDLTEIKTKLSPLLVIKG